MYAAKKEKEKVIQGNTDWLRTSITRDHCLRHKAIHIQIAIILSLTCQMLKCTHFARLKMKYITKTELEENTSPHSEWDCKNT